MITAEYQQNLYSCAVALNNIAVCLLNQHCYEQALSTLTDALNLMRLVSRVNVTMDDTTTETSLYYQRACCRLAKPQPDHPSENGMQLHVISGYDGSHLKDDYDCSRDCKIPDGPAQRLLFLFRIESIGSSIELDSSMMLHNFAMAYLCRTTMLSCMCDSTKLLKTGYKVLRMALVVLGNTKQEQEDLLCSINVSILILRSLVKVSNLLGLDEEMLHFHRSWKNFVEERREIERFFGGCCCKVAAAA